MAESTDWVFQQANETASGEKNSTMAEETMRETVTLRENALLLSSSGVRSFADEIEKEEKKEKSDNCCGRAWGERLSCGMIHVETEPMAE